MQSESGSWLLATWLGKCSGAACKSDQEKASRRKKAKAHVFHAFLEAKWNDQSLQNGKENLFHVVFPRIAVYRVIIMAGRDLVLVTPSRGSRDLRTLQGRLERLDSGREVVIKEGGMAGRQ